MDSLKYLAEPLNEVFWWGHLTIEFVGNFFLVTFACLLTYYYLKNRRALYSLRAFLQTFAQAPSSTTAPPPSLLLDQIFNDRRATNEGWQFNSSSQISDSLLRELLIPAGPQPNEGDTAPDQANIPAEAATSSQREQEDSTTEARPQLALGSGFSIDPNVLNGIIDQDTIKDIATQCINSWKNGTKRRKTTIKKQ